MTLSLGQVSLLCVGYLLVIFGVAWITERGWIPDKVVRHPITYILSLGIFASAWSFYGVVDLAFQYGYGALAYYLGTGALFLFAPVAIRPLAELARRYQIHSLADLLVFRYHSNWLGALATLCMLLAVLPLLTLQIQAVTDTLRIITEDQVPDLGLAQTGVTLKQFLAFMYCALVATFTIMFGANREQHRGMITAMALESLLKVAAICAVGIFALFFVFDGVAGLDQWLLEHPENLALLHNPMKDSASSTLILVFFATAVAMPHIFHMSVVETPMEHSTQTVSWAFPLFLLFMALPVFPILWAGFELGVPLPAQYFTLGVPMVGESHWLTLVAFVGGLSAATGAMVVIALAMSTMLLNHWLLPLLQMSYQTDIYARLMWLRRTLIAVVFLAGFMLYLWFDNNFSLAQLALMAFIATLQFLPAISAVAYWPRGNRLGASCALATGASIWALGLLFPSLLDISAYQLMDWTLPVGINYWSEVTLIAISANTFVFVTLSLLTSQGEDERFSADICADDELSQPLRLSLELRSAREFRTRLADVLGPQSARDEVARALGQLGFTIEERRPYALRRLRDQIEANLSGLMGIGIANDILDRCIPYAVSEQRQTADINLMESRLGQLQTHLTGMAAELNRLRLYHRQTLQLLPMAACSLGQDGEILMWNDAMERLTGIAVNDITGSSLEDLDEPWGSLIRGFAESQDTHLYKQSLQLNQRTHWISLHKALLANEDDNSDSLFDGQVILLEDVTETQLLEQELVHSERLASVGRLAAGVAHEIGNPITGIACLAQNLHYESDDGEVHETANQILSQTDRVSRIVHSLVSFSHSGNSGEDHLVEPMNMFNCAQEAINLISLQKDRQQVGFSNHIDPDLNLLGDSQRMIQVFVNLLSNARDASPEGSEVSLWSDIDGDYAVVSVEDEGSGIPPELMDRIMEPFFTTKEPGQGTGLGLAMVYSIVEDHNGLLNVHSPADESTGLGTRFDIRLPLPRRADTH